MDMGSKPTSKPQTKAGQYPRTTVFEDRESLSRALMAHIDHIAQASLTGRHQFTLALSGGSLLDLMALGVDRRPKREEKDSDWSSWHFFWVDERWVPWEDAESNHGKARKGIFSRLGIPGSQIYPLDYAMSPAENVQACEAAMRTVFQTRADQLPRFDLILLGVGEDGHTASLFPGHPAANESQRWMAAVFDAPKRPPIRITMTLPLINNARNILFVAAGAGKGPILARVLNPPPEKLKLPAQRVVPTQGTLRWFVDRAAAAGLAAS